MSPRECWLEGPGPQGRQPERGKRSGAPELPILMSGCGFADYLLYVDRKAAGVIEAKKRRGIVLTLFFERISQCRARLLQ